MQKILNKPSQNTAKVIDTNQSVEMVDDMEFDDSQLEMANDLMLILGSKENANCANMVYDWNQRFCYQNCGKI